MRKAGSRTTQGNCEWASSPPTSSTPRTAVPGADIKVELFALNGDTRRAIKTIHTNDDGRADAPLLEGAELDTGEYELVFHAGDYFAAIGVKVPEPRFVDRVVLRFGIADAGVALSRAAARFAVGVQHLSRKLSGSISTISAHRARPRSTVTMCA